MTGKIFRTPEHHNMAGVQGNVTVKLISTLQCTNVKEARILMIMAEAWHAGNWQGYQEAS